GCHLLDLHGDPGRAPTFMSVSKQPETGKMIRQRPRRGGPGLRRRWIRHPAEVPPECRPPYGALVREDVRRIEVKVIDDVAVGDWGEREQIVNGRPSASGHDHRMLRRRLTDRRDELRLHATPPVTILELGLVQHLEEQSFIVEAGEMPSEVVPELRESIDLAIV